MKSLYTCVILILLLLSSCRSNPDKIIESEIDFNGSDFPNYHEPVNGISRLASRNDTLLITAYFSECGEFGGRNEKIYLYNDNPRDYKSMKARITIDSVDCNKIVEKDEVSGVDETSRVIVVDTTVLLTNKDKKIVNLFLHRMIELYMNHEIYNNSPNLFEAEEIVIFPESKIIISSSSSDLYLKFWNMDQLANTWYGRVRKELLGKSSL